ncbi:MAG: phosphoenolpyruvate carboxykinase (ATP), partial [Actinobacteria bacterium]|nr:phosphoenolpyruvate carboxykinase (ATP) [Actinomycetota bacterium]
VGERIDLPVTRAIVDAAVSGALAGADTVRHPILNLDVPSSVPGVAADILDPRSTWPNPGDYDAKATELAQMIVSNFERFASSVPDEVLKAGPKPD